jgi:hypothetical protein
MFCCNSVLLTVTKKESLEKGSLFGYQGQEKVRDVFPSDIALDRKHIGLPRETIIRGKNRKVKHKIKTISGTSRLPRRARRGTEGGGIEGAHLLRLVKCGALLRFCKEIATLDNPHRRHNSTSGKTARLNAC